MVKAAIVGCGRVSGFHARAYQKLKDVKLVAGVDIAPEKRDKFAETYGVTVFNSLKDLLAAGSTDLISICTPNFLHFEMAKEIMKRGVNVIIEKPICLSVKDGGELLELERKTGVVAATCFQNRFNPVVEGLIGHFEQGRVGEVLLGNVCVRWYRDQNYYSDPWHGSKSKSGGGALITQAIHHVDLLRLFMGELQKATGFCTQLRNRSGVEDTLTAALHFTSGGLATIECSTIAYPKDIEASISLIGEKGVVKIGGKTLNKLVYSEVDSVNFDRWENTDDPVSVYGTSHILLIKDVVEAIISGRKPKVSLKDGVETLKMVLDIYASTAVV